MRTIITALAMTLAIGSAGAEALAQGRAKERSPARTVHADQRARATTVRARRPVRGSAVRATRPAAQAQRARTVSSGAAHRPGAARISRDHRDGARVGRVLSAPARDHRAASRTSTARVRDHRAASRTSTARVRDHRAASRTSTVYVRDHRRVSSHDSARDCARYVWQDGRWVLTGSRWTRSDASLWFGYPTALPPAAYLEARYRGEYYDETGLWVWIPGYWDWYYDEWVWVPGYWTEARVGYAWEPGYWAQSGERYRRVPGRWVEEAGTGYADHAPVYSTPEYSGERPSERVSAVRAPVPGGRY